MKYEVRYPIRSMVEVIQTGHIGQVLQVQIYSETMISYLVALYDGDDIKDQWFYGFQLKEPGQNSTGFQGRSD